MAVLPVEFVAIGDVPLGDVTRAAELANEVQSEFTFVPIHETCAAEIRQYAFRRWTTTELFVLLDDFRLKIRGFHPYLIAIIDADLSGPKFCNLFGSHEADRGLAAITIANVPSIVIPTDRMAAYFVYYFARYTLSFISPGHTNHDDSRGCVFDRKIRKHDLLDSMRARALCDDCRKMLIGNSTRMTAQQFASLDTLFALSGKLLDQQTGSEDMPKTDTKPRVFVGSSAEGLKVARAIQSALNYDCYMELWTQSDVFTLGIATLEALEAALDRYDYAIFVFTPDDQVTKRNDDAKVARDNVIFEAGLFIGRKGRRNAFIVQPRDLAIQLPSDLLGITTAKYEAKAPNLDASVGDACNQIRKAIR